MTGITNLFGFKKPKVIRQLMSLDETVVRELKTIALRKENPYIFAIGMATIKIFGNDLPTL